MPPHNHTMTQSGLFIDIQGTLIKANKLNEQLYQDMIFAQDHGAQVTIFTMDSTVGLDRYLKKFGIDVNRFSIHNKFQYRGHLFTGLIVDDISPKAFGFELKSPKVHDVDGMVLHNLVKTLNQHPRLSFNTVLRNHFAPKAPAKTRE